MLAGGSSKRRRCVTLLAGGSSKEKGTLLAGDSSKGVGYPAGWCLVEAGGGTLLAAIVSPLGWYNLQCSSQAFTYAYDMARSTVNCIIPGEMQLLQ